MGHMLLIFVIENLYEPILFTNLRVVTVSLDIQYKTTDIRLLALFLQYQREVCMVYRKWLKKSIQIGTFCVNSIIKSLLEQSYM